MNHGARVEINKKIFLSMLSLINNIQHFMKFTNGIILFIKKNNFAIMK